MDERFICLYLIVSKNNAKPYSFFMYGSSSYDSAFDTVCTPRRVLTQKRFTSILETSSQIVHIGCCCQSKQAIGVEHEDGEKRRVASSLGYIVSIDTYQSI